VCLTGSPGPGPTTGELMLVRFRRQAGKQKRFTLSMGMGKLFMLTLFVIQGQTSVVGSSSCCGVTCSGQVKFKVGP
jgi:hypothetical protein